MISAMSSNYMSYLGSNRVPVPLGASFGTVVPYTVFAAQDRAFSIAIGSEKLWAAFCETIAHPELTAHPSFATNPLRVAHRPALEKVLAAIFKQRPMAEWVERLRAAGIPCSPVLNFEEVAQDPQAKLRDMFPVIEHPVAGPQRITGTPIKLSATPGSPGAAAPRLGEDTASVLKELLALSDESLLDLQRARVIVQAR
jgi:crotonobetainyl-CoA:carnitine CoA-transferase CaiB-like acyl-CoA transferase